MYQVATVRLYILDVPTSNLSWNTSYSDYRLLDYPKSLAQSQDSALNYVMTVTFHSGLYSLFTAIQSFSAVWCELLTTSLQEL
jgi:hypothetical protein